MLIFQRSVISSATNPPTSVESSRISKRRGAPNAHRTTRPSTVIPRAITIGQGRSWRRSRSRLRTRPAQTASDSKTSGATVTNAAVSAAQPSAGQTRCVACQDTISSSSAASRNGLPASETHSAARSASACLFVAMHPPLRKSYAIRLSFFTTKMLFLSDDNMLYQRLASRGRSLAGLPQGCEKVTSGTVALASKLAARGVPPPPGAGARRLQVPAVGAAFSRQPCDLRSLPFPGYTTPLEEKTHLYIRRVCARGNPGGIRAAPADPARAWQWLAAAPGSAARHRAADRLLF